MPLVGRRWGKREPYKKHLQPGVPKVFFALTSTETKDWNDEFMRRVLLFNTKPLRRVTGEEIF